MLNEKTNQDYNKQKPDPKDPNQSRNHQISKEEELENKKKQLKNKTNNPTNDSRNGDEGNEDAESEEDVSNLKLPGSLFNEDDEKDKNTDKNRDNEDSENKSDYWLNENSTENHNSTKERI